MPGTLKASAETRSEPALASTDGIRALLVLLLDLETRPAVIVLPDGIVAGANSAMVATLQRRREEFNGILCDALFTPESQHQVRRFLRGATAHNDCVFDTTFTTGQGVSIPVTLRLRTTAADARGLTAHCLTIIAFREADADPALADGLAYVVSADSETFGTVKRAWGPSLQGRPSPIGRSCYDAFCGGEAPCKSCPIFAKRLGREGASTVVSRQAEGRTLLEVVRARPLTKSEIAVSRWKIDSTLMSAIMSARIGAISAKAKLSAREVEVFQLLLLGRSVDEIARELHIVARTAKYHQHNILRKVGAESRADLSRLLL